MRYGTEDDLLFSNANEDSESQLEDFHCIFDDTLKVEEVEELLIC